MGCYRCQNLHQAQQGQQHPTLCICDSRVGKKGQKSKKTPPGGAACLVQKTEAQRFQSALPISADVPRGGSPSGATLGKRVPSRDLRECWDRGLLGAKAFLVGELGDLAQQKQREVKRAFTEHHPSSGRSQATHEEPQELGQEPAVQECSVGT